MTESGTYAGQGVIVLGAAGGIGRAIAAELRAAGARLALWDLVLIEAGPGEIACEVDLTRPEAVEAALARSVAAMGHVVAMVHAAGILGPVAMAHETSLAAWRRVFEIDCDGVFVPVTAYVRHLLAQPRPGASDLATGVRGRIVVIASQQAKEGMPRGAAYSAAKAAVLSLVKSMGKELAREGILVNAVTPTAIETPMARELTPERRAEIQALIPMGRFGTAAEVARLAVWLASPACTFSTGAVFDLSGGRATY